LAASRSLRLVMRLNVPSITILYDDLLLTTTGLSNRATDPSESKIYPVSPIEAMVLAGGIFVNFLIIVIGCVEVNEIGYKTHLRFSK
jgi:hypothetical protein